MFKLLALLAVAGNAMAVFTITTPASLTQCEPALFKWSGGVGPYWLSHIPAGQPSAVSTEITKLDAEEYTWIVNLQAGTAINVKIKDSTGAEQYTSNLTVNPGSDDCLKSGGNNSPPAETPAETPNEAPVDTPPAPQGEPEHVPETPAVEETPVEGTPVAAPEAAETPEAAPEPPSAPAVAHTSASSVKPSASIVANATTSGAPSAPTAEEPDSSASKAVPAVAAIALAGLAALF